MTCLMDLDILKEFSNKIILSAVQKHSTLISLRVIIPFVVLHVLTCAFELEEYSEVT